MCIDFDSKRWSQLKKDTREWWDGELDRPLIQVRLKGRETGATKSSLSYYPFTSFYDDHVTPDQIVDVWHYELCRTEYLGDAYPVMWPNFGAGVISAFLGANLQNGQDTVWFHPAEKRAIEYLIFQFSEQNKWFLRIKEIVQKSHQRWGKTVQIGLTDLGGSLDILASFRPGEELLFDLYDYPEEVKRALWEIHELWFAYFNEFCKLSEPYNPGYTNWTGIFSEKPSCILQCDFSYMISPEMFNELAKPEMKAVADKLSNVFFHLDGKGQLPHLDSILDVDSIKGIQWVPGDGQPDIAHWPDVYKKISDAGKKIQFFSSQTDRPFEIMDIIADQIGRSDNIVYIAEGNISQQKEFEGMLRKYNIHS